MSLRSRLDLPALADPVVRDLLQESDVFARSFTGMGGFGLFSPLDAVRILGLLTELASHLYILLSLTRSTTHVLILVLSLASSLLPLIDVAAWLGFRHSSHENVYSAAEIRALAKQEQMRSLVYNDSYRPEILVFGLGTWVLESWASARRTMLGIEQSQQPMDRSQFLSSMMSQINLTEIFSLCQNVSRFFLRLATCNLTAMPISFRYFYFFSPRPPHSVL
jgi:hypothetical protein